MAITDLEFAIQNRRRLLHEIRSLRIELIDALIAALIAGENEKVITGLAGLVARCSVNEDHWVRPWAQ